MTMQSISDLAIFGAAPAFNEPLHVGRPNIGNKGKFYERLDDILDRRWLTNDGCYVGEFEQKVAEYLGVKHCIAICNGTIALEIAIRALGLTGEVILPSFTFVATASALRWQGITPVFCDIDYQTYGLDWREIERAITPRTTGIIGVHVFGRPCATEMLTSIAKGNGLSLLFDAAHAFGCSHGGRMIGNFGNAEVFSFHATKFFNTFEGGAIVTNDDELAERVRLMKNFGFAGHGRVGAAIRGGTQEIVNGQDVATPDRVVQTPGGRRYRLPGLQRTPIPVYLTLITSMFMHGSWAHLLGNMLFL
ncbi:hypothetical protein LCGC14_3074370, partial [marine sediment metagenome]